MELTSNELFCQHGEHQENIPAVGIVDVDLPIDGGMFRFTSSGEVFRLREPDGRHPGYYHLALCRQHFDAWDKETRKIGIGWYGWIDDHDRVTGRPKREARVVQVLPNDSLLIDIGGIPSCQFECHLKDFTPDPEALWFDGHIPDPEEFEAEKARVRQLMGFQES